MLWYGDNAELHGARGADIQDTMLFGGVAVPAAADFDLRKALEAVKRESLGAARYPIKWNMKDLKSTYARAGLTKEWERITADSQSWRRRIIEQTLGYPFAIIVACVESHSLKRRVIKLRKVALESYAFSNALMRVALHARETGATNATVILDWPPRNDREPFDCEYRSAFTQGMSYGDHVLYRSGPLKDIGFRDHVCYASMEHATMLQFADVVVGAVREFLGCAMKKREPQGALVSN
jgi:hypothetical protein